jgi:CHAD domain-containing protein
MQSKAEKAAPVLVPGMELVRVVFIAQWKELLRCRRKVLKTSDAEDIHDLRVASRRFRAAIELFEPFSASPPKQALKKNVRVLTRDLGGLRNIDEALFFFKSREASGYPVDTKIRKKLAKLRPREFRRIRKALLVFDRDRLDKIARKTAAAFRDDLVVKQKLQSLSDYFADVSGKLFLPIEHNLAGACEPEHREARHALRIAIKKWRYFFEITAQVLERDYNTMLSLLKEYQTVLGRMNDIAEFEILIGKLKLPAQEREFVDTTLRAEDDLLLRQFRELVAQKPLAFTFQISAIHA